jgi:hypothetical protein
LSRCYIYFHIGCTGAIFNLETISNYHNCRRGVLSLAFALIMVDIHCWHDPVMVLYLCKTAIGDWLAGKLDNRFMRRLAILAVLLPFVLFVLLLIKYSTASNRGDISLLLKDGRVAFLLWLIHTFFQFCCEFGDNYKENWLFFRHRYSYELSCVFLAATLPLFGHRFLILEESVLLLDMTACLAYRITNLFLTYYCLDKRFATQLTKSA